MSYREEGSQRVVVSGGRSVSALDLATGGVLWTNADFGDAAGGALLVTDDRVYVAGWKQAGAIDATTGRTVWKIEILPYGRPALLREGDHLLVAGSGIVQCLSIDGRTLWAVEVPKGNSMSIAVGDRVAIDDRER
jgi:outer membrane protein assembly factor BamB